DRGGPHRAPRPDGEHGAAVPGEALGADDPRGPALIGGLGRAWGRRSRSERSPQTLLSARRPEAPELKFEVLGLRPGGRGVRGAAVVVEVAGEERAREPGETRIAADPLRAVAGLEVGDGRLDRGAGLPGLAVARAGAPVRAARVVVALAGVVDEVEHAARLT